MKNLLKMKNIWQQKAYLKRIIALKKIVLSNDTSKDTDIIIF